MEYLCLAYRAAGDWKALSTSEQDVLLAQDEAFRKSGDTVAAVEPTATTVRARKGTPTITYGEFAEPRKDLDKAIQLVALTPCARAKGAMDIRPIAALNEPNVIR
jgi:hypothetical protein